jgi:hypothetical protein
MLRVAHHTVAAALITLTLSGCRDSIGPPSRAPALSSENEFVSLDPGLIEPRRIPASATDVAIDYEVVGHLLNAEHLVWPDRSTHGHKLLVFLPGARNVPVDYKRVEQEAARLGYYVIGLMYQNAVRIDDTCKGSDDVNCSGDIHSEVLTGAVIPDISSRVNVTPANGIDNRLTKLLMYLSSTKAYAGEGWSRFLEIGVDGTLRPRWSVITVAGHSQGGAQAALIAQLRYVPRVVLLSAPPDSRIPGSADAWVGIGETPSENYFALYHDLEPLAPGINLNLFALQIPGDRALVRGEAGEFPYGGSHVLRTDLTPRGGNPHGSTARDTFTPLPTGCMTITASCPPKLTQAWRYLMGEPPHSGIANVLAQGAP